MKNTTTSTITQKVVKEQKQKSLLSQNLSLWQKLLLPYYFLEVFYFCLYVILQKTNNVSIAAFFVLFITYYSAYLNKDSIPYLSSSNAKYFNQSAFTIICLFSHVIATDLFLAYMWIRYDQLINGPLSLISAYLMMMYTVVGNLNCCHELIHRSQFICRLAGYINLGVFQFAMYPIQHLYVHHKKVGSPEDPITAQKNYLFYKYYFRAIALAYKTTFQYSKMFFLLMLGLNFSYIGLLSYLAISEGYSFDDGCKKVAFMIAFSYFALFTLQAVQYIEHYGLIYRKSVQKNPIIQPQSSWNAQINYVMNLSALRFQRHSDHHMNAYKSFPSLDLTQKMPQFPFDFPVAMTLCLIPPLWYKIMNPYVDEVLQGKTISQNHRKFTSICAHSVRFLILVILAILVYLSL